MRLFKENLVIQFSAVSLIMMLVIGTAVSAVLTTRLSAHLELMQVHLVSGPSMLDDDINNLRWVTLGMITGGFAVLYGGLVGIVWGGWKTIVNQRSQLQYRTKEMDLTDEVARIITSTLHIDRVYGDFARELKKLVVFERASISTVDSEAGTFKIQYIFADPRSGYEVGKVCPLDGTQTGHLVSTGHTLARNVLSSDLSFQDDQDFHRIGLESSIAVPLVSKSRVIGSFILRGNNAFGKREEVILERLARQIAPAVENAELFEQVQASVGEMALVDELAKIVTCTLDIDQMYERFAVELKKLVDFDQANIKTIDPEAGELQMRYLWEPASSPRQIGDRIRLKGSQTDHVIMAGQTLVQEDVAVDTRKFLMDREHLKAGLRSCIKVPLISKTQVLGSMTLRSRRVGAYGPREQAILERLASQIAPAIENSQLYLRLQASMEEMDLVDEVAGIITSTLDIDQVYEKFALEMKKLVDSDRIAIHTIDQKASTSTLKYLIGPARSSRAFGTTAPLGPSRTREVLETGLPLLSDDTTIDPQFPSDHEYASNGMRASIVVPLICKGRVIGALSLRSHRAGAYGPREQQILERLASQIAPAIENARLYQETLQAEEALRESEERYRAVAYSAPDAIVSADGSGNIISWNRSAQDIFGYTEQEIIGERLTLLMPEQFRDSHRRGLDRISSTGESNVIGKTVELQGLRKDGSQFPLELSLASWQTEKETFYTGIIRDITGTKELNAQLLQAQKMESVGRLAGGVAHDFNNMLTPIIGYAQLGKRKLAAGDSLLDDLNEIQESAERACGIIGQLLSFSRRQRVEPRVIDLNLLIAHSVNMLRSFIGEDILVSLQLQSDRKLIKVDPNQMEQLLVNMAVNARDAMPEGGNFTVGTHDFAADQESTAGCPGIAAGDYVMLEIGDNGIGMTDEVKAHIFEPFFTTKDMANGTGLGLATCYGIVKQAGGEIVVESEPGQGTTFKIYLPATNEGVTPVKPSEEHEILPRGTETILLVEDDEKVRTLASKILQGQGYSVFEAADGAEALVVAEDFTSDEIHLLLTDVIMPEMGGLELADRIVSSRPSTKVLYWSGYADGAVGNDSVLKADTAFMSKPFSPPALALKVREVLDN